MVYHPSGRVLNQESTLVGLQLQRQYVVTEAKHILVYGVHVNSRAETL